MTWSIRRLFSRILTRRRKPVLHRTRLDLAEMEKKCVPAVTSVFDNNEHTLAIVGSSASDGCVVSHNAAGQILVNGAVTTATLSKTDTITISLGDSQDSVTIDESNGLFESKNGTIKFQIDGGGDAHDYFNLKGTNGADLISLGMADNFGVIDVNGDGAIDVTLQNLEEFYVRGGDGNDTIDASITGTIGTAFAFG